MNVVTSCRQYLGSRQLISVISVTLYQVVIVCVVGCFVIAKFLLFGIFFVLFRLLIVVVLYLWPKSGLFSFLYYFVLMCVFVKS